ncbi:site-specific integrase [Flavobacterium saccharophilum]|uniref:Site-specific recombinase XerD n=1 Tax=Flavobacterium saccharophilum TaxID=29534 RepID=A0A1M7MCH9_9FLAO|nr:site-specific integrase [Flavobacterium saccharophilum]SHM88490.1 Site-specific recombinase XerD [Flavobacterium saccharophilum]
MLKVYFHLKFTKNPQRKESQICARLTYQQQTASISTGQYISKERWDLTNKLRNVLKLEKEKIIRTSLDILYLNIEKKCNEIISSGSPVSLVNLKNALKGRNIVASIIEILETHIKFFKKKVNITERSKASLQKYIRSKDLIAVFIQKEYNKPDVLWNKISSSFIYKLESFIKYESTFKGRTGIKNNSTVKYMRMYKTACNYALKIELINKNPFSIYDGKIIEKDAVYLSQKELNTIQFKKINSERLEKTRDIFIFCCYTGYAPIDALSLTDDNITADNNNDLWIKTVRAKTSINSNVPILSPVQEIIDKYKDLQTGLIPRISNQKMNKYLKEIAVMCRINKKLTWYTARHTFATTVTLGNGVRIENVSSMMGHTNILQTQHYAKILDINVKEDMNKVIEKYKSL